MSYKRNEAFHIKRAIFCDDMKQTKFTIFKPILDPKNSPKFIFQLSCFLLLLDLSMKNDYD